MVQGSLETTRLGFGFWFRVWGLCFPFEQRTLEKLFGSRGLICREQGKHWTEPENHKLAILLKGP